MGRQERNPAQQAAMYAFWAPLATFAIGCIVNMQPEKDQVFVMAWAVIVVLVMLSGVAAATYALCRIPRYGPQRVLVRSIVALIINVGILSMLVVGVVSARSAATHRSQANQAAFQQFDANAAVSQERAAELLKQASEGQDVGADAQAVFADNLNRVEQLSRETTGRDAQIARVLADTMRSVEPSLRQYNFTMEQFIDAGGISPQGLASRADIHRRLHLLEKFAVANEQWAQTYAQLEQRLRLGLAGIGLNASEADQLVHSWKRGARPDMVVRMRHLDRQLVASFRELLMCLDEGWGQWSIDDQQLLDITNEAIAERYDAAMIRMQAAEQEQRNLQYELSEGLRKLQQP